MMEMQERTVSEHAEMERYVAALEVAEPARFVPRSVEDLKRYLAVLIREHVRACYKSQYEAAAKLGTRQPRISDIVNGMLEATSADYLFRLALAGGLIRGVEVQVECDDGASGDRSAA